MVIIANTTSTMCRTRALTTEAARPIRIGFPSLPLACRQGGYVGWGTGSNGNITFPVAFTQNLTFATGQGAEGTSIPRTSSVSNTGAVLFNVGTDGGHYSGFAKWIATGL